MIPVGKIQVTFSDITGSRHAEVTMKSSLTAEAAIQKLLSNNFLSQPEPGQVYTIINSFNQKEIQPNQTFFEAGVQNGDTLIVGILTRGGGGIPIRSFRDVQLLEGVINNNKILRDLNGWVFFALILYTEEDKVLSTYIREHILDIHEMSGSCIFFVIEEPSTEWLTEAKRYLGTLTEIYFDTIWKRLGVDSYKPFDKSKAYEIARHFGIQPKQLPCIIFFTELSSQEIVIIQQYLRQLDSRNWFKNGVNHAQAGNLFKDLG